MNRFEGHTPGPWRADDQIGPNHWCLRRDTKGGECDHDLDNEGSWQVVGPPHTGWVGDTDTSFARKVDAELAAAAPDLLAALCALLDRLDRPDARLDSVHHLLTHEQRELLHQLAS